MVRDNNKQLWKQGALETWVEDLVRLCVVRTGGGHVSSLAWGPALSWSLLVAIWTLPASYTFSHTHICGTMPCAQTLGPVSSYIPHDEDKAQSETNMPWGGRGGAKGAEWKRQGIEGLDILFRRCYVILDKCIHSWLLQLIINLVASNTTNYKSF